MPEYKADRGKKTIDGKTYYQRRMERHDREGAFQKDLVEYAVSCGWMVYHVGNTRGPTPVVYGPGFPDLVMARTGNIIFAELKSPTGCMSPAQRDWAAELLGLRRKNEWPRVYCWRPRDWDQIEKVLS